MLYEVIKSSSSTDIHILAPGVQRDTVKAYLKEGFLYVEFQWPETPEDAKYYFYKSNSKCREVFSVKQTVSKIGLSLKDGILVVSVQYESDPQIEGTFTDA